MAISKCAVLLPFLLLSEPKGNIIALHGSACSLYDMIWGLHDSLKLRTEDYGLSQLFVVLDVGQKFCGQCGSRMVAKDGGHVLSCSSESCGNSAYPRLVCTLPVHSQSCIFLRQVIVR